MKLIKTSEEEYRIEGLKDYQVLRILKALEVVNDLNFTLELDVLVNCLKGDISYLNRKENI